MSSPVWHKIRTERSVVLCGDDPKPKDEKRNLTEHRLKICAQAKIWKAVRSGRIIKPTVCSRCPNTERIEAHHYLGYAKEHHYDIVWLCKKCHHLAHHLPTETGNS